MRAFVVAKVGNAIPEIGKLPLSIHNLLKHSTNGMKDGQVRVIPGLVEGDKVVWTSVVQVPQKAPENLPKGEETYYQAEIVRKSVASALNPLLAKGLGINEIQIDSMGNAVAAAEATELSTYRFEAFKKEETLESDLKFTDLANDLTDSPAITSGWKRGAILGQCQNYARYLADLPGNHLTPSIFAKELEQKFLANNENGVFTVKVRNLDWIREQGMSLFLGVSQGSEEEPKFVEIQYRPVNLDPRLDSVLLVGKGITFDSGGISIKPSAGMASMKGDMGGAAVVASTMLGAAHLKIPRSITAVIPMCENMPSGKAYKPGDVIKSKNGKSVEIDNTDAEGRLLLADALYYGIKEYTPKITIDVATLTGAMVVALGSHYCGTFSTCPGLFEQLKESGLKTGDRMWQMPLSPDYGSDLKSSVADIKNSGGRSGGSCSAAHFLSQFVDLEKTCAWAHIDMAGVMDISSPSYYFRTRGMTGRPTRTLLEYLCSTKSRS